MNFFQFYLPVHLCLWLFFLTSSQCTLPGSSKDTEKNNGIFVDSTEASVKIISADVESFFDHITSLDMAIQMKSPTEKTPRDQQLTTFKKFLSTQVSNWNADEKKAMNLTLVEAKKLIQKVNPAAWPNVKLAKIKTDHYGKHVYYTRGNIIFIPENIFEKYVQEEQLPVMIHEIFHILSKQNPAFRDTLFQLIGFKKLPSPPLVVEPLSSKLLTNPDGVTRQYVMEINTHEEETSMVIPLISSKFSKWKTDAPHFFDYLAFDVYPIVMENGQYVVQTDISGNTTMPLQQTPRFFTKIKDNTQYIIHPEEIMADNFMLAVLHNYNPESRTFSSEGKKLIDQVLAISRAFSFAP